MQVSASTGTSGLEGNTGQVQRGGLAVTEVPCAVEKQGRRVESTGGQMLLKKADAGENKQEEF